MNKMRTALVEKAFAKMDKTGDGVVTVEDLKHVYNVKYHPDFQNGTKTESELLRQWLAKFEQSGVEDGIVSVESLCC